MDSAKATFRHLCLLILLVCSLMSASQWAQAAAPSEHPVTPELSSWLDTTGQATLASVQEIEQWEPFSGWKGWAFGPEPVWIRVHVPAATGPATPPFVLIVQPTYLDDITFYDPAFGKMQQKGDFFAPDKDDSGSLLFTFDVPALDASRDVFLKVQTTSTRLINLKLMPSPDAKVYIRWVEWLQGAVLVISLVFLVWSWVQVVITRDRVMLFFSIKQLMVCAWGFLFLGHARISIGSWFAQGTLSLIGCVVVAGVVSSVFWFFSVLLVEYKARPWMLQVLRVAAILIGCSALLNFVGMTRLSLQIISTTAPCVLLWIVLTLWATPPSAVKPPIPKVALLAYLCLFAGLNSLPALTYIGFIQESPLIFLGNINLLLIDGLMMLVILNVRQQRFKQTHHKLSSDLAIRNEQARLDQQYLEEQRKLLSMLGHEMKTSLAVLRIWMEAGTQGKPVMERAIEDMNRMIEGCVHAGQLSDHSIQPRNDWLDACELTESLVRASRQPGQIHLHEFPEASEVYTDAQMLSIVLSNILENACLYSQPQTPIDVWFTPCDGPNGVMGWCWRVENTVGLAGVPDAQRVFDKYYRGPHAQRQSGSGLGLFLAKSLLDMMQGTVAFTQLNDRVRFEFWLPVKPDDIATQTSATQA